MGLINDHQTASADHEDSTGKRRRLGRRWAFRLAFGVAALLALTAVLGYQARGLEGRVLEAVQPHLLTDVQVGAVALTVWDSWPNVEVVLSDVRIEDAVQEDAPFVELKALGVVFAWKPLLFGQLEVAEVVAQGGQINVHRYRDGRENWQFWKPVEGADAGVDWTVEAVVLSDVQLDGEWWSEGAAKPVVWSAFCRSASLALDQVGDSDWTVEGDVGMEGAALDASGDRWLDEVGLKAQLNVSLGGGDVEVTLVDAEARNEGGRVDFEAVLGNRGGFSLALLCTGAEGGALLTLVPPGLIGQIEKLPQLSGAADVEVLVGSGRLPNGWAGPQDENWSEDWAVSVVPRSLSVGWNGQWAELNGGKAFVYPQNQGWSLAAEEVQGRAGGGEFRCSGGWSTGVVGDHLALQGEMVARPEEALPWLGEAASLPVGWGVKTGGVVRAQFDVEGGREQYEAWSWSSGTMQASATDVGLNFVGDGPSSGFSLDVAEAQANASPDGWELNLKSLVTGGANGDVVVRREAGGHDIEVEAQVVECNVTEFLDGLANVSSEEGTAPANFPRVQWSVEVDQLRWEALSVGPMGARGSYDVGRQKGVLAALNAQAFDGDVEAHGVWDIHSIELQGSVLDVELSAFLEGTQGLGQTTLLPSHVRGRLWADGSLEHHFGKAVNLAWETQLEVRVEQGELLDFELLQRIPETLKAEGKYRFIADAEDLSKRLKRVQFEPLVASVSLSRGVFTLDPTEVVSDAMDVGIAGWQRLSGGMDYTLDFALRDLKSDQEEFGTTADDGLGHRFFLAIGGTLEDPEFGYDRSAHKLHRQDERRSALGRLKGLILGENRTPETGQEVRVEPSKQDSANAEKGPERSPGLDIDDDDDDFSP